MIFHKTKLIFYKGKQFVDLRSDELELAKKSKSPIRIVVGNEFMDVKRKVGKSITKQVFDMQYPPYEKYTLKSFEWKPQGVVPKFIIS